MSSRERVLLSLSHKEPDRVPIAPPHGRVNLSSDVERFIETFEFDRFVSLNFRKNVREQRSLSDDLLVDNYGCIYKSTGVGMPYCVYNPLANAKTLEDVEKYPRWPDPDDPSLILQGAHERAKKIHEETSYVTFIDIPNVFHKYQRLRGFNRWLMDIKVNPELHQAIAGRICEFSLTSTMRLLNEVGDYTDLVMTYDDMGFTTGPFMSVEDFRRFVKPYYKRMISRIGEEFPKIKFWLHCHGNIMKLMPDIIDSGFEVLNPILPGDTMAPERLKDEFGRQLSFDGGVDVERIIPFGTVGEVREHAKKVINTLAPGGGYIFRVQMISHVVPPENLYAAYETALEYGSY